MTDETTTEETPLEDPVMEPTEPEAPVTPPERTLIIQMQFSAGDGSDVDTYATKIAFAHDVTAEQYAKEAAERVERTALLHLGALPVLTKVAAA